MTDKSPDANAPRNGLAGRIAVTLGVIALMRLLAVIPLPGLNPGMSENYAGAVERVSLLSLNITPWLSAVILAEAAILILPLEWTRWLRHRGHADPFAPAVLIFTLAVAAFQSVGISIALESIPNAIPEPGLESRLGAAASLTGATAVMIAGARLIQKRGIGHGFWVLWSLLAVFDFRDSVSQLADAGKQGLLSLPAVLTLAGCLAASFAIVIFVLQARRRAGLAAAAPLIWPIPVCLTVLPWLSAGADFAFGDGNRFLNAVMPDRSPGFAVFALAMTGTALIYGRRENHISLAFAGAGALIAVLALSYAPGALFTPGGGHFVPGPLLQAYFVPLAASLGLALRQDFSREKG